MFIRFLKRCFLFFFPSAAVAACFFPSHHPINVRYIAERQAREAIEMRAQIREKAANKERDLQEQKLRDLAQKARDERVGVRALPAESQPKGKQ